MGPKSAVVVLAACCLSAHSAWAQSPTAALAPPNATPTAGQLELSHELLVASGAKVNFDKLMTSILRQAFAQATQGQAEQSQQDMASLERAEETAMLKLEPKIFDVVSDAYAETYTEEEMRGLLAFYKTPTGQALVAKAPVLAQHAASGMFALIPIIRSDTIDSICNAKHCTAPERQAMLDKMSTPHT